MRAIRVIINPYHFILESFKYFRLDCKLHLFIGLHQYQKGHCILEKHHSFYAYYLNGSCLSLHNRWES